MAEYHQTSRHPMHWVASLLAPALGGGCMAYCVHVIRTEGLGFTTVAGIAAGCVVVLIGMFALRHVIFPIRYAGSVSDEAISWTRDDAVVGRLSRAVATRVDIGNQDDDVYLIVTSFTGSRTAVPDPRAYFGDLAKLNADLIDHGYQTKYYGP